MEPSLARWPSIASPRMSFSLILIVDVGSSSVGKWPSITRPSSAVWMNLFLKRSGHPLLQALPEFFEEVVDTEDDPTEWPSIVLDDVPASRVHAILFSLRRSFADWR